MERAPHPQEPQASTSRIRRAVSRPWDFLKAHLRPVCRYVRRQFKSHGAAAAAARARRRAHLHVLQTKFHPDVVASLHQTPWLEAQLAAGAHAWDESQRAFPDRVAHHVLTRLHVHNFSFVERTQVSLPPRSVRHLESVMELVFKGDVARDMAAAMGDARGNVELDGGAWWVPKRKTVEECLTESIEILFREGVLHGELGGY